MHLDFFKHNALLSHYLYLFIYFIYLFFAFILIVVMRELKKLRCAVFHALPSMDKTKDESNWEQQEVIQP